MTTLNLFNELATKHSVQEIANRLLIHKGTIDRWIRTKEVPPFYQNDLLRLLGKNDKFDIGVSASDQYYTVPATVNKCLELMEETFSKYKIKSKGYYFVEPSAGCGNFFNRLPKQKRIGIDIDPKSQKDIIKADFLTWHPKNTNGKYIVVGNPPFGRNGKTALDFILHGFIFADFVCFILPPIFNSTGKGSCKNRMNKIGYTLLCNFELGEDSFARPDGQPIKVKTVFQVWAKQQPDNYIKPIIKTCESFIDIYNICVPYKPSRAPSNVNKIGKCDIYLPRSFWDKNVAKATSDFVNIPYKDGYGIVVKRKRGSVLRFIEKNDWSKVVHTSTNSSKSLRKDIIKDQLIIGGFHD